jgi:hypothetical protein
MGRKERDPLRYKCTSSRMVERTLKESVKRWADKNKLYFRNVKLLKRYGISLEEYGQMLKVQDGRCKICNKEKVLHVDHCHASNKIRGLLCQHCNNGLGCFKDDPILIDRALEYLRI